jgi:hypothetical protein
MFTEPVSYNGFLLVQNNLRVIWQVDVAYLHELLADSQIIKVSPAELSRSCRSVPACLGRTSRDAIDLALQREPFTMIAPSLEPLVHDPLRLLAPYPPRSFHGESVAHEICNLCLRFSVATRLLTTVVPRLAGVGCCRSW